MEILVPIFICCVLPVCIIAIVFSTARNNDNRRAEVLIKAIESGNCIDAEKLIEALSKPKKTAREILNKRLLTGCVLSFIGLGCIVSAVVGLCTGVGFANDQVSIPMMIGGVCLGIGVAYLVVWFVTRRQAE